MKFSLQQVYANAWEQFKVNAVVILVTMFFLPLGLVLGFVLSSVVMGYIDPRLIVLVILAFMVIMLVLKLGVTGASLEIADGKKFEFNTLFVYINRIFSYLGTAILFGIVVIAGLAFFIVPGLIFMAMFSFAPFLALEGRGPIAAMQESAKLTDGHKWDIFLFLASMQAVLYLGYLAFGIGMFVAMPVTMIAGAHVYRKFVAK